MSLEVESINKIRPLGDLIVVKRDASKSQTPSGIQLPNVAKSNLATVIAVGPGQALQTGGRMEPQVAAGDRVMIGPNGGQDLRVGDEVVTVVREYDLVAVIDG
jgi:chaperonin GroES